MKYPRLPEHLDRRKKMLSEDIAKAKILRKQGKSYKEIGEVFGVSETAAQYAIDTSFRERAKERARLRSKKVYAESSPQDKARKNQQTVVTLMRKRELQPEYKTYSDKTHYKYANTLKASETRKKYYADNADEMRKKLRAQYKKHKAKRLVSRREYVKKNYAEILAKSKAYYCQNKDKILAKHKAKRSH